jgi:hypothetical protein
MTIAAIRALLQSPEGDGASGSPAPAPAATASAGDSGAAEFSSGNDVDRVLEALRKERQDRKAAEAERARLAAQLQELQQGGQVAPQLFQEAQRRAEIAEQERQVAQERLEQVRRETESKFSGTVQELSEQLKAERAEKQRQAVRFAARDAFLAADGRTDASSDGVTAFDYFWSQFGGRFGSDEKGLFVTDPDGDPVLDSETGKRLDPQKWLAGLRDDPLHGTHFKGQYGSGGGSRSNRDGRAVAGMDVSKMSTEAKFAAAFGRKR